MATTPTHHSQTSAQFADCARYDAITIVQAPRVHAQLVPSARMLRICCYAGTCLSGVDFRDLMIGCKGYVHHVFRSLVYKTAPSTLAIEITDSCGRRCAGCYHGRTAKQGERTVSSEFLRRIVDEARKNSIAFIGLIGGEPISGQTLPLIQDALKTNPRASFYVVTNGDYIAQQGLGQLEGLHNMLYFISVDGYGRIHDDIRGAGSFGNVLKAFARLRAARKFFGAVVTIRRDTARELTDALFLEQLARHGLKLVHFLKFKSGDEANLSEAEFKSAVKKIRRFANDYPMWVTYGRVNARAESPEIAYLDYFVSAGGDVRTSKLADTTIGNLRSASLRDILTAPNIRRGALASCCQVRSSTSVLNPKS